MGVQRIDDAVRRLPKVWLGPAGSWRWPFDARYSAWSMWFALTPVCFLIIALALPVGLVVGVVAWIAGRRVGRRMDSTAYRWTTTGVVIGIAALVLPPTQWVTAAPVVIAVLAGPLASLGITRAVMRHVDYDRPLRYWINVARNLAAAPRPTRAPAQTRPVLPDWAPTDTTEVRS